MRFADTGATEPDIEGSATQWRALGFLAVAKLLGMILWFSAAAVVPTLKAE